jgi:hypothetical protein
VHRPAALAWITLLGVAAFSADLAAQEGPPARNRTYVEVLGTGIVYSLNYERDVADALSVRVGTGGLWVEGVTYLVGLSGVTWRLGTQRHAALVGVNVALIWLQDVWVISEDQQVEGYAGLTLGYRFQPSRRGFFLQAAFTPIASDHGFAPWGGLGLGWAF